MIRIGFIHIKETLSVSTATAFEAARFIQSSQSKFLIETPNQPAPSGVCAGLLRSTSRNIIIYLLLLFIERHSNLIWVVYLFIY